MAVTNTLNLLPEPFRSVTNQRFLGATMDQLVTDAANVPVNGYIGRTFAPTYKLGDNYVPEPTTNRANYQLEPSVVIRDGNGDVIHNSEYIDLLQSIDNTGGLSTNQQRLFGSQSYNYDGHFDYDKFVNYHNYYWLPNGPANVTVTSGDTPLTANYTVTRNTAVDGYTFSGLGGHPDQQITLARGGTYTFTVDQLGYNFWIQAQPGADGRDPNVPTIGTRKVFGVTNNGTDAGVITFNVPLKSAQDFYAAMPTPSGANNISAAVTFNYSDIQNTLLSDFLGRFPEGLDGITNQLLGKTLIFINNSSNSNNWEAHGLLDSSPFDNIVEAFDSPKLSFAGIVPETIRPNVWKINLVPTGSDYIIQIIPIVTVTPQHKVFITSGKTYAGHQFWLDTNYNYELVPLITATKDYLYYQDSSNPGFVGVIKLVDNVSTPIDIKNDIIGKTGYTSPNGVIFTNGLKIRFDTLVTPNTYANNEYYVEGAGTSIALVPVSQLVVPDSISATIGTTPDYITINRSSQDCNPWSRSNRWFHKDVLAATATYNQSEVDYGLNIFGRRAIVEFEPNLQLYNFGKQAKNTVDLITFASTDAFVDIEGPQTYPVNKTVDGVTLTQGMRVIFANDYDKLIENEVWQVDFQTINSQVFVRLLETTDDPVAAGECLTVTQGATNAGKTFWFDGTNWHDSQAKTSVQQPPLFDLVDADGYSFADATMYPNSTFAGTKIFGYPIVTGTNDTVLGFPLSYQNFNNIGDIVFQDYYISDQFTYTTNTTTGASESLACSTGYILKNTGLTSTTQLNNWIPGTETSEQYQVITKFYEGYQVPIDGRNYTFVQIDIFPRASTTVPHLKVYLNNVLLNPYTDLVTTANRNGDTILGISWVGIYPVVALKNTPALGDKIDVKILSNSISELGFYEVPSNLDFNPLNQNFPTVKTNAGPVPSAITLGQLRTHYNKLIENTTASPSTAVPNQDRYLKAQGGTLLQHSSPVVYGMTFLTNPTVSYVNGISLARQEYTRFKNKFLSLCESLRTLNYTNPQSGVDTILQNINSVKNSSFPWYYSDMIPQGSNYNEINYTVLNSRQTAYEISSIFNITQLSNRAVLVYHNGVQLTANNNDYYYDQNTSRVVINVPLTVGDTITIRDYFNTDGNFVPETPVKLGLAQAYPPAIYLDTTYQTPIMVIRGHDGSITPAFGDFRDDYLLELEKRIYNNIKVNYNSLNILNQYDTVPGRFRSTDYSLAEWSQLLTKNFLQWVGSNNIDYTTNTWFDANNPWTWNYSQFTDVVDGSYLQGSWRAVYKYWFDTDQPHLAPWEMLGFVEMPDWWETRYGPAPYTNGNTTLWEDLETGYVWNGSNSVAYTDTRFARPGLVNFIPVDSAGNLLNPVDAQLIRQLNTANAGDAFQVGQQGPVETAWRRSSDYLYAVQQALALARPAEYFSTQIDLSRFYKNPVTGQFTDVNNQKLSPGLLRVNGDTTTVPGTVLRTAGYLNWISDLIKNLGIDPITKIESYFKNFNVQLAYRVGGFTDQNLITVKAEQTSPGSTNASVIIPNENYTVYLNKSVPVNKISYSAVIVSRTETGYSVAGYDTTNPYFVIEPSVANNQSTTLTVNNSTVKLYQKSSKETVSIPYGTTFTSVQQVSDFLISYQRHLVNQGFKFEQFDTELEMTRDWTLSINEFLFWAQQGWNAGVLIVLNPIKDTLDVQTIGNTVDEITNYPNGSRLLDVNFRPIKNNNFNILRSDYPGKNQTQITTVDGLSTIAFAELHLVQFETTLIFDNVDNFGDILYIPEQGTRQYRLKLTGAKTGFWDGALSAAGYIYSNPIISVWQIGTDYKQGDIVTYNNSYYTAPTDIVASQTFSLSQWTQISLSALQTGLLPSFGHNAQIFENIYDIDNPPQDKNYQLFSSGLIGFRERPFLSNLGIDISTQTKFYQGYIKQKGTQNAITALTSATFDTVNSTINTYEEWAFQVGRYGDIDNNQYTEFVLDQSVFTTNPVAFTSNTAYSTGNIIVNLNGNAASHFDGNLTPNSNVYNSSNLTSTITSLYNNRTMSNYSQDLPTCGYVNLADIDYQIFDIAKITQVPALPEGKKLWVAKDFNSGWNVYRTANTGVIATTLNYTLGNYAQLVFNSSHGLNAGDYFVLQNFNTSYNGMYQVNAVNDSTSIKIIIPSMTALVTAQGKITGIGSVFKLDSMVIDTYSQIGSITPTAGWIANDRVWVNTDTQPGATGWAVYTYDGATWTRTRQEQPRVDITSINRTFIYNKNNNVILSALDYIDPAKGKVLSSVGTDIDFQLARDPALYNVVNLTIHPTLSLHSDYHWGPQQVGKIWWNLDAVRYIDYEQDKLIYRMNHWGEAFPGSNVLVYEWVESPVLPSQYVATVGNGIPLYNDDSAYSTYGTVGPTGTVTANYYFWVIGKTSINTRAGKSNSVYGITTAIVNPQAQGIPYATVLRDDTVALYNVNKSLIGTSSVLHLGSRSTNAGLIHSEYALVQEGNPVSILPTIIKNKLIDSLAGQDTAGNQVPDPDLTPAQAYGIGIRPRQSLFVDRSLALSNYLTLVNKDLLSYPIVERKLLTTLNSKDTTPHPDSNSYSIVVSTRAELNYVDTAPLTIDYKILVAGDETNLGKWAIYSWSGTDWVINPAKTRIVGYDLLNNPIYGYWYQTYKTNLYWSKVDWYQAGYDYTVSPNVTVANRLEFGKLTLAANTYIKVLNNGNNQFEIYYIDNNLSQTLVGIQNGTLQISTSTMPSLELRQILLAVQNDILVDDLAGKYNQLFFTMVKYALSEQKNIEWAFKTSFLSATQYIRALAQFPSYIPDNQDYYLNYINEVKPYRTTVREFVVDYQGLDPYTGDITDFDLPPYYDANVGYYRSPNGEQPYDATTLSNGLYSQWSENYKYQVVDVIMERPGIGYTIVPQVTITPWQFANLTYSSGSGATGYATINGTGGISSVVITTPGEGYVITPNVNINGTGVGATARAVLRNVFDGNNTGHNVIRSIQTTLKFDRVGYTSSNIFVFWDTITSANIGDVIPTDTIMVLDNKFYHLDSDYTVDAEVTFPVTDITQVYAGDFDNANDRIVAYRGNIDLTLTQSGLNYSGVIVDGNTFTGNVYDSLIQSRYTDSVGVNPSDIIIDGGQYVDRFESYAPEEFVPGRMYDSLNLTVRDTDHLAFRLFEDMNTFYNSYRITSANTTTLASNLNLTDNSIFVTNAAVLPLPDVSQNIPGVVFINGEKITYWRNYALETKTNWHANVIVPANSLITYSGNLYLTTGNVYAPYFANITSKITQVSANTIAQIRRAVDGTSPALMHSIGSQVIDSSIQQLIPGSANSNVVLSHTTVYTVADKPSLGVTLTGTVTGKLGDVITQTQTVDAWQANTNITVGQLTYYSGNSYTVTGNVYGVTFSSISSNVALAFAGNTSNISTMILLENATDTKLIPVILLNGNITVTGTSGPYDAFSTDPEYAFGPGGIPPYNAAITYTGGGDGFDNTVGTVHVNGADTGVYITNYYILGKVNNSAQVTINSGTQLTQSNVWYNPGLGYATNGLPLVNSTTPQATFLKASRYY